MAAAEFQPPRLDGDGRVVQPARRSGAPRRSRPARLPHTQSNSCPFCRPSAYDAARRIIRCDCARHRAQAAAARRDGHGSNGSTAAHAACSDDEASGPGAATGSTSEKTGASVDAHGSQGARDGGIDEADIAPVMQGIARAAGDIEAAVAARNRGTRANRALAKELQETRAQLAQVLAQQREVATAGEKGRPGAEYWERELKRNARLLARARSENARLEAENRQLRSENSNRATRQAALEQANAALRGETQAHDGAVGSLAKRAKVAERERDAAQQRSDTQESVLLKLRVRLKEVCDALEAANTENGELRDQVRHLSSELADLRCKELSTAKLRGDLEKATEGERKLVDQNRVAQQERDALIDFAEEARRRIVELESQLAASSQHAERVTAQLKVSFAEEASAKARAAQAEAARDEYSERVSRLETALQEAKNGAVSAESRWKARALAADEMEAIQGELLRSIADQSRQTIRLRSEVGVLKEQLAAATATGGTRGRGRSRSRSKSPRRSRSRSGSASASSAVSGRVTFRADERVEAASPARSRKGKRVKAGSRRRVKRKGTKANATATSKRVSPAVTATPPRSALKGARAASRSPASARRHHKSPSRSLAELSGSDASVASTEEGSTAGDRSAPLRSKRTRKQVIVDLRQQLADVRAEAAELRGVVERLRLVEAEMEDALRNNRGLHGALPGRDGADGNGGAPASVLAVDHRTNWTQSRAFHALLPKTAALTSQMFAAVRMAAHLRAGAEAAVHACEERVESERAAAQATVAAAKADLASLRERLRAAEAAADEAREDAARAQEHVRAVSMERDAAVASRSDAVSAADKTAASMAMWATQEERTRAEHAERVERLRLEVGRLRTLLDEAEARVRGAEARAAAKAAEVERLQTSGRESAARIAALTHEVNDLRQERGDLRARVEHLKRAAGTLGTSMLDTESRLHNVAQQYEQLRTDMLRRASPARPVAAADAAGLAAAGGSLGTAQLDVSAVDGDDDAGGTAQPKGANDTGRGAAWSASDAPTAPRSPPRVQRAAAVGGDLATSTDVLGPTVLRFARIGGGVHASFLGPRDTEDGGGAGASRAPPSPEPSRHDLPGDGSFTGVLRAMRDRGVTLSPASVRRARDLDALLVGARGAASSAPL